MGLGTALRAFFVALGGGQRAEAIRQALSGPAALPDARPATTDIVKPQPTPAPPPSPSRSDAISLLSALQREARLIDLVKEPLDGFSDAQIGAAARPCLKQCAQVIDRMFDLASVTEVGEGETLRLPDQWTPARYQAVGGSSPAAGSSVRVVHPGWQARHCKLPQWTGHRDDALIIAAAQVESA